MTDAGELYEGTREPGSAGRPPLRSGDEPDAVKAEGDEDGQDPDEREHDKEEHPKPAEPERP
jgi:hypothetical protein